MGDNYLRLWNPKSGKEDARFTFTFGKPSTFTFVPSPDGRTVVVSYYDKEKELRLFDVASGKEILRLPQPARAWWPEFAPDGTTLIVRGDGVRLWDVKTGKELWRLRLQLPEKSPLQLRERWETSHRLAFSPDGKLLAVSLEDGSIHLCDMKTGVEVRRLFRAVRRFTPSHLAFSPDSGYLAANADDKFKGFVIRLWDMHNGELVRSFSEPNPPLPDDLGSMVERQAAIMKDPLRARERYFADCHSQGSDGLAFSPDGKTLVNACFWTQLWEVATGRIRHEFDAYTYQVCFSPVEPLLAASCWGDDPKDPKGPATREGIFLWNWRDPCLKQPARLDPQDIERLWRDLASPDAPVGYRTIATLLAHPRRAVAALGDRLRRVEPVAPGELEHLTANLDDETFSVREKAVARLAALGEASRPTLLRVKAQSPSLEVRRRIEDLLARLAQPAGGPESLRCLRAVEVLETIDTEEARRVLVKLASGADRALQTEDAKAALKRLKRR
jgi:WD40 repeat protein